MKIVATRMVQILLLQPTAGTLLGRGTMTILQHFKHTRVMTNGMSTSKTCKRFMAPALILILSTTWVGDRTKLSGRKTIAFA